MQPFVFSAEWFRQNQSKLLKLANSRSGRRLLRIHGKRSSVGNAKITKILPNAIEWVENGEHKAEFRTHDKFAKRLYYGLKPVWFVLHGWDFVFGDIAKQLDFGFSTLTAYPDPDAETTSVDGMVRRSGNNATWADIRDGAGTAAFPSITNTACIAVNGGNLTDGWNEIRRSHYLFDTSALTAGVIVSAAVLSIYGTGQTDSAGITPNIDIYTSTPASNTDLVAADYGQVGTTSQTGSPITYAGWSTSAYNDFTFNATGIGNVSLTGISKFGARNANYDVANSTPTWSASIAADLQGYFADQTDTTNDPKLVVTYAAATTTSTSSSVSTSSSFSTSSTSSSVSTSFSTSSTSSSISTSSTSSSISISTSSTSISTSSSTSVSETTSTSSTSSSISTSSTSSSTSTSISTSFSTSSTSSSISTSISVSTSSTSSSISTSQSTSQSTSISISTSSTSSSISTSQSTSTSVSSSTSTTLIDYNVIPRVTIKPLILWNN